MIRNKLSSFVESVDKMRKLEMTVICVKFAKMMVMMVNTEIKIDMMSKVVCDDDDGYKQ